MSHALERTDFFSIRNQQKLRHRENFYVSHENVPKKCIIRVIGGNKTNISRTQRSCTWHISKSIVRKFREKTISMFFVVVSYA